MSFAASVLNYDKPLIENKKKTGMGRAEEIAFSVFL